MCYLCRYTSSVIELDDTAAINAHRSSVFTASSFVPLFARRRTRPLRRPANAVQVATMLFATFFRRSLTGHHHRPSSPLIVGLLLLLLISLPAREMNALHTEPTSYTDKTVRSDARTQTPTPTQASLISHECPCPTLTQVTDKHSESNADTWAKSKGQKRLSAIEDLKRQIAHHKGK